MRMLYATSAMKHWAICFFILLAPTAFCADGALPDGKGKDVVISACSSCHSLDRITALAILPGTTYSRTPDDYIRHAEES